MSGRTPDTTLHVQLLHKWYVNAWEKPFIWNCSEWLRALITALIKTRLSVNSKMASTLVFHYEPLLMTVWFVSYCHITHPVLMFKSHLRNDNRLYVIAYLWARFRSVDLWYAAQCLRCNRWIRCGTRFTTQHCFFHISGRWTHHLAWNHVNAPQQDFQGSAVVWEMSFLPFGRGLLPLVAEMLVVCRASKQHHAEHKLQRTSASCCPRISHTS